MTTANTHEDGTALLEASWWHDAVFYQVYIRSFADGNGDGFGDIAGLLSRLDYLQSLGVDAIWVNPWYLSPFHDGGYDVADYRVIDPRIGTVAEVEELVQAVHNRGMRILADLVPNHTSSGHQWFQEALASPPGSSARARYHFRPGRGAAGAEPPTNWLSVFGGPAWTRVADGEWYLHLFDVTQPDLNWENPEVRAEFVSILRFWLDRGIDGFRVDVAHALIKDMTFPDVEDATVNRWFEDHPFVNREPLHGIAREWRAVLDEYSAGSHERMMVAEAVVDAHQMADYLRADEYHQAFNFPFLDANWNAQDFSEVIESSVTSAADVGSVPTWVLGNHDRMRPATRFGLPAGVDAKRWLVEGSTEDLDFDLGIRRTRAAALLLLALPGSAYIYQGEELGLHEVWDLPGDILEDPTWTRSGGKEKGRDGCRVPLPWTGHGSSLGFGSGGSWLPQPEWFPRFAVETQLGDSQSTLELYRSALALRRQLLSNVDALEIVESGSDVLILRRGASFTCVVNFGDRDFPLPPGDVVLVSGDGGEGVLGPGEAAWLLG